MVIHATYIKYKNPNSKPRKASFLENKQTAVALTASKLQLQISSYDENSLCTPLRSSDSRRMSYIRNICAFLCNTRAALSAL